MILIPLLCLVSYLVGALPFGLWIGLLKGVDIRTAGSGNIGATNVLRVLGPVPGALSLLLDVGKGTAGVLAFRALWSAFPDLHPAASDLPFWSVALVGLCAILGHTFSPFLRFKGGKGVATTLGALLALCYPVALVGLAVWLLLLAATRYVSVASIAAAISLPITAAFMPGDMRPWMLGITIVLMVLVIVKHRSNIARLRAGTEMRIGQRATVETPVQEAAHHD